MICSARSTSSSAWTHAPRPIAIAGALAEQLRPPRPRVRRARGPPRRRRRSRSSAWSTSPASDCEIASSSRACGRFGLPRASVRTASSASARILATPLRTAVRTQEGQPRVDRGAAVGQGAVVARALGRVGPALAPPPAGPRAWRAWPPSTATAGLLLECPVLLQPVRASARRSRHDRFGRPVARTARPAAPRGRRRRPPAHTRSPPPAARRPQPIGRPREEPAATDPARLASAPNAAAPGRGGGSGTTPAWCPAGTRNRLERASDSSMAAEPLSSRTASQSGPDKRVENGGPRQEAKILRRQVTRAAPTSGSRPRDGRSRKSACALALPLAAPIDSAARYRPADQPSACSLSWAICSSGRSTPAALRSWPTSASSMRRSSGPISKPGPVRAALPAGAPAGHVRTEPSASPATHVSRAPRWRRGMPGCRARADRPGPRRPPGPSLPETRPGGERSSLRPTRRPRPVPRTRPGRAARRGRARPRHMSGERSDRCPSRRRRPRRTVAATGGPLRQQRRLSPAWAGGHENERERARALFQRLDELRAVHRPGASLRRPQLRLEQLERWTGADESPGTSRSNATHGRNRPLGSHEGNLSGKLSRTQSPPIGTMPAGHFPRTLTLGRLAPSRLPFSPKKRGKGATK